MIDFHYPLALTAELTKSCRVVSNRNDLAMLLPKRRTVAQLGASLGDLTEMLLRNCNPSKVQVLDPFNMHTKPEYWESRVSSAHSKKDHETYFRERLASPLSQGRVDLLKGEVYEAITWLTDGSVGAAWIQDETNYRDVRDHLTGLLPKMAPDGVITVSNYIISDYLSNTDYGVIQATNEFMINNRWEMIVIALEPSMFCDIVIRRSR